MQSNIQASCSHTDSDSGSVAFINTPNIIMEKWRWDKKKMDRVSENTIGYIIRAPAWGTPGSLTQTVQSFTGDLTQLTAKAAGMPSQSVSFYTRPMGMDQKLIFREMEKMKVSCQRVLLKIG